MREGIAAHFMEQNKTGSQHCIQIQTINGLKTYQVSGEKMQENIVNEMSREKYFRQNFKNIYHKPNNYEWIKIKDI